MNTKQMGCFFYLIIKVPAVMNLFLSSFNFFLSFRKQNKKNSTKFFAWKIPLLCVKTFRLPDEMLLGFRDTFVILYP